jgi:hypothetical protein
MRFEPPRPLLERRRLWRELNPLPGERLLIAGVEVLEQNPPGHAVDGGVMDGEEHSLGAVSDPEMRASHDRTAREVEARLEPGRRRLQGSPRFFC